MDSRQILENIRKHVAIDDTEAALIFSFVKARDIKRKEYLLKAGETCQSIFFVNEGMLRAYYRDDDLNESIIMFAIADWWITDMYSFATGQPAMLYIDALEETSLLELTKADLEILYQKIPKLERFFRILMQNAYIREQLRAVQNLSMTAEERYEAFQKKYPLFSQRVPLKQIASYLGMTPEFLSVVRRKKNTTR